MAFTCLEAIGAWLDPSRRSPPIHGPGERGLKLRLLLRRLGQVALDLGVDTGVVQGAGDDRDRDGSQLGAAPPDHLVAAAGSGTGTPRRRPGAARSAPRGCHRAPRRPSSCAGSSSRRRRSGARRRAGQAGGRASSARPGPGFVRWPTRRGRPPLGRPARSVAPVPLLAPWVTVVVVAQALPKPRLVLVEQPDPADPLGAFCTVEKAGAPEPTAAPTG
jgi:hypothetical protein